MNILEENPDLLRSIFDYDDGNLIWKNPTNSKIYVGDLAGWIQPKGYLYIMYYGASCAGHRLIYTMHHGIIPDGLTIDHKNRNKYIGLFGKLQYDNHIDNLRLATLSEQKCNQKTYANNTTGHKGIIWYKSSNLWVAQINKDRKVYKKYFQDLDKAVEWRKSMEVQLHEDFTGDLFTP